MFIERDFYSSSLLVYCILDMSSSSLNSDEKVDFDTYIINSNYEKINPSLITNEQNEILFINERSKSLLSSITSSIENDDQGKYFIIIINRFVPSTNVYIYIYVIGSLSLSLSPLFNSKVKTRKEKRKKKRVYNEHISPFSGFFFFFCSIVNEVTYFYEV